MPLLVCSTTWHGRTTVDCRLFLVTCIHQHVCMSILGCFVCACTNAKHFDVRRVRPAHLCLPVFPGGSQHARALRSTRATLYGTSGHANTHPTSRGTRPGLLHRSPSHLTDASNLRQKARQLRLFPHIADGAHITAVHHPVCRQLEGGGVGRE